MYQITIHPDADGGVHHLLHLLTGYSVEFKQHGVAVASGIINGLSEETDGSQYVSINDERNDTVLLNIWEDFNEVVYL
jgi:hypothetical protein